MASYQQQPNLQALQIQPVQSLNQQAMQTIGARSQYYIQSLSQIKGQYDNAVHKNLSDETNKAELEQMTLDVDNKIKELTHKDLSVGDISSKAKDLMKPISQNANFIYDEHITNKVQSQLQKAQSEANEKGSNYYHMESVKALSDTLNDLRTARQDSGGDPKWYSKFLNDTLGTTYVPYDPKVDEKFDTESRKFLKDLKNKYTQPQVKVGPDGQPQSFYLSESEVSAVTDMEMSNWLKSNRPEQQVYRNQLKAKNEIHDIKQLIKQDPIRGNDIALNRLNSIKENARVNDINIVNRTINNLKAAALGIASTESPKYLELIAQIEGLEGEDGKGGYKADLEKEYAKIKPSRFVEDSATGYKELADLYDRIQIGSTVGALGLDQATTTLKSDASATSIQMNREKIHSAEQIAAANRQADMAKELLKAKASGTGARLNEDGSFRVNPNVSATTALGGEATLEGKDVVENVHQQLAVSELDVKKKFLEGNGAVVRIDGQNVNVLDFLRGKSETFGPLLDKADMPAESKELLKVLADTGGRVYSGEAAANRIIMALENPETLSKALQRVSVNLQDPDGVAQFGYQLQELKNKRAAIAGQFAPATRKAGAAAGIDFKSNNDEDVVNFSVDQYTDNIIRDLKGFGISEKDKSKIVEYINGGASSVLLADKKFGALRTNFDMDGNAYQVPVKGPLYEKIDSYKKTWDKFKKEKEKTYLNSGNVPLANAATFTVVPTSMESKSFDDNSMIYESNVVNVLQRASTTLDGGQQSSAAFKGFDAIRGKLGDAGVLNNMTVVDNGTDKPYVKLSLKTGAAKKLKEDASQEDISEIDDFVENASKLKFYIPKEELQRFGFGQQSKAVLNYKNGGKYSYKLPSGGNLTLRNVGMGNDLRVAPEGEFLYIQPFSDGSSFQIVNKKVSASTLGETGIGGDALTKIPEKVGQNLYTFDMRASTLKNILQSHGIDITKPLKASDIQNLKEKDVINKILGLSGLSL